MFSRIKSSNSNMIILVILIIILFVDIFLNIFSYSLRFSYYYLFAFLVFFLIKLNFQIKKNQKKDLLLNSIILVFIVIIFISHFLIINENKAGICTDNLINANNITKNIQATIQNFKYISKKITESKEITSFLEQHNTVDLFSKLSLHLRDFSSTSPHWLIIEENGNEIAWSASTSYLPPNETSKTRKLLLKASCVIQKSSYFTELWFRTTFHNSKYVLLSGVILDQVSSKINEASILSILMKYRNEILPSNLTLSIYIEEKGLQNKNELNSYPVNKIKRSKNSGIVKISRYQNLHILLKREFIQKKLGDILTSNSYYNDTNKKGKLENHNDIYSRILILPWQKLLLLIDGTILLLIFFIFSSFFNKRVKIIYYLSLGSFLFFFSNLLLFNRYHYVSKGFLFNKTIIKVVNLIIVFIPFPWFTLSIVAAIGAFLISFSCFRIDFHRLKDSNNAASLFLNRLYVIIAGLTSLVFYVISHFVISFYAELLEYFRKTCPHLFSTFFPEINIYSILCVMVPIMFTLTIVSIFSVIIFFSSMASSFLSNSFKKILFWVCFSCTYIVGLILFSQIYEAFFLFLFICLSLFYIYTFHFWEKWWKSSINNFKFFNRLLVIFFIVTLIILPIIVTYFLQKENSDTKKEILSRVKESYLQPSSITNEIEDYLNFIQSYFNHNWRKFTNENISNENIANKIAFRIWLKSPFKLENRFTGISIYSYSRKLLGEFGVITSYINTKVKSDTELNEPYYQNVSMGKSHYRFVTIGRIITPPRTKPFILLIRVALYSFPIQAMQNLTLGVFPINFSRGKQLFNNERIIQTEYSGGAMFSSIPNVKIPLPKSKLFLAKLNKLRFLWQKMLVGSKFYDVLFFVPSFGSNNSEIVSFALQNFTLYEIIKKSYSWWMVLFLTISFLYFFFFLVLIILKWLVSVLVTTKTHQLMSYRMKVIGAFLVISIIPLITLSFFIKQSFEVKLKQEVSMHSLQKTKEAIDLIKTKVIISAQFLAEKFLNNEKKEFNQFKKEFEELNKSLRFSYVSITDSQGFLLFDWSAEPGLRSILLTSSDDLQSAQAFKEAAPIVSYHQESNRMIITVVCPLIAKNQSETIRGTVMVKRILTDKLLRKINDNFSNTITLYGKKNLLATSYRAATIAGFIPILPNSNIFQKLLIQHQDHYVYFKKERLFSSIKAAQALYNNLGNVTGMLVISSIAQNSILMKNTTFVYQIFLYYLLPIMLLILLLGNYLSIRIYNPIKILLAGINKIAQGELSYNIPEVSDNEFQFVINSFNEMTREIREDRNILEERKNYIELILQNVTTGIIVFDSQDRITTYNKTVNKILNIPNNVELKSKNLKEFVDIEPLKELKFLLNKVNRNNINPIPLNFKRENQVRYIQLSVSQLNYEDNKKSVGWIMVLDDLTDLLEANRRAALVDMARQVAHEVKNPLTPIQLSTEHLIRTYEDKASDFQSILRTCTNSILAQVKNLRRLTTEFSNFAKLPKPNIALESLNEIISSNIVPTKGKFQKDNNINIILKLDYNIPKLFVDRGLIEQVLLNLYHNSLQAISGEGILIISTGFGVFKNTTKYAKEISIGNKNNIWICFDDNGEGIAPNIVDRIFEPYFSTKDTGTGLGLLISKRIIEEHNGEIRIFSEKGTGTLVVILLKYKKY